jgi:hypothetical protein
MMDIGNERKCQDDYSPVPSVSVRICSFNPLPDARWMIFALFLTRPVNRLSSLR